ncbi:hypothetical protein CTH30272_02133 [Allocatenococcus thiocycli]|nr:hypothetical protein CTH30272_02133 [Catenococcus thiocycli]
MNKQQILGIVAAFLCVFVALFDSVSRIVSFVVEGSIMVIVLYILWTMVKAKKEDEA